MKKILYAAGALACFSAGWLSNRTNRYHQLETCIMTDTLIIRDTVTIHAPVAVESRKLPARITTVHKDSVVSIPAVDSSAVMLPAVSLHYSGELYDAYISGVYPSLDSIKIHVPSSVITRTIAVPKKTKWHFGIGAGVAATPKGVHPYVGVGVTYSLFAF